MSDIDPQTRDLRTALRATDPGARPPSRRRPTRSWIGVVVLIILGGALWWAHENGMLTGMLAPMTAAWTAIASGR